GGSRSLQHFDGAYLAQALGRWCPLLDFLEELLDAAADFCGWVAGKDAAQSWLGQLAQCFQLGGRGRPHLELVAVQIRDELLDLGVRPGRVQPFAQEADGGPRRRAQIEDGLVCTYPV